MALTFPNTNRSYDATYRRVRFVGHDGVIEVAFFLQDEALVRIAPNTQIDEPNVLDAFDQNRGRILDMASRAYRATRRHFYVLDATDV